MELGKEIEKYHSYKSFAKRIEAPRQNVSENKVFCNFLSKIFGQIKKK